MEITVENAVARFPEFRFREPLSWKMGDGECWAVIGPNGAGKTLFTNHVQGSVALKEGHVRYSAVDGRSIPGGAVRSLFFRDIYSVSCAGNMYYQQRWNSRDVGESPLAASLFEGCGDIAGNEYALLSGVRELTGRRIISLSSGELRKLLIARALMSGPEVLVLDNPFIGLDEESRKVLDAMLSELKDKGRLQTVIVVNRPQDIPEWVDKVLPVMDRELLAPVPRDVFLSDTAPQKRPFGMPSSCLPEMSPDGKYLWPLPVRPGDYGYAFELKHVSVKYGGVRILDGVDWSVRKGEHWALTGGNGSGKSTLLSLVCGDNPQAYANDISIFGRKRGSGESIWDIKRRIGYLSPDVHSCYQEDIPCLEVVASGFRDSTGLSHKCTEEQSAAALSWLGIFHAEKLADRSFLRISYGEQRLVLLARAFVKSPEMLVLDEPFHGLDAGKKALAKAIIDEYCSDPEVTLVFVSHYLDEIPSCVDRTMVMKRSTNR